MVEWLDVAFWVVGITASVWGFSALCCAVSWFLVGAWSGRRAHLAMQSCPSWGMDMSEEERVVAVSLVVELALYWTMWDLALVDVRKRIRGSDRWPEHVGLLFAAVRQEQEMMETWREASVFAVSMEDTGFSMEEYDELDVAFCRSHELHSWRGAPLSFFLLPWRARAFFRRLDQISTGEFTSLITWNGDLEEQHDALVRLYDALKTLRRDAWEVVEDGPDEAC